MAADRHPDILRRVALLPVGAGNAPLERVPLFTEHGNLGNTVVGTRQSDACKGRDHACLRRAMRPADEATILPLDVLFPEGLGCARLLKLDTQGFECKVLHGARRALRSSQLLAVVAEATNTALTAQCCSGAFLKDMLRVEPSWNVSCTSAETCVGRSPNAARMARLWQERPVNPRRQRGRRRRAASHGFERFDCSQMRRIYNVSGNESVDR